MMYFKSWSPVALFMLAVAVHALDFHSDEAAACATRHWDEIREIVNPKISMMDKILPKANADKIHDLLGGKKELSKDPPPRDWLGKVSKEIPDGMMAMFGKDIIEKCVNEMKH